MRHIDDFQMAGEDVTDIVKWGRRVRRFIRMLSQHRHGGARAHAFARGHQQLLAIGRDAHRARIPAGGNESEHRRIGLLRDVDHRDVVVVSVGNVKEFSIGAHRQRIRGRPDRVLRIERGLDGLDDLPVGNDAHAVRSRIGNKEPAIGSVSKIAGMGFHRDARNFLQAGGLQQTDRLIPPVGNGHGLEIG